MDYDFSKIEDDDPFAQVPEGVYLCCVADVRTGMARDGSEQWGLRLEVVGGEHHGRTAAWDNLTWSERGVHRVKRVLEVFGFDVSGMLTIEPTDLKGLKALVTLQMQEYEGAMGKQRRMAVPYQGYAPACELSSSLAQPADAGSTREAMPF